ncbi:hypothetical protein VA596_50050 [Amycolatopsis sp., V23-08]|uniref:HNH endonuclease n=1 Tax=Amycolatopsis heterodermiae TaxID=3110235 RepID=A0ABU5RN69_9PSEU|nr:hypothetical protein [Amycolatopsis sp., V23-08]MEA5367755.1 hypothetical protein [Amycolatopsis sp., V23-08]
MNRTTARRARKPHRCPYCSLIKPGDVYLEHVVSPDHDGLGNTGWLRLPECASCARSCGRGHLIDAREATP